MKFIKILTVFLITTTMLTGLVEPVFAANAKEKMPDGYGTGGRAILGSADEERMLPLYYEDIFIPASPAFTALAANTPPAAFSDVEYEFAEGVVVMDSGKDEAQMEAVKSIATAGMLSDDELNTGLTVKPNRIIAEGAFIDQEALDEAIDEPVEDGTVVVDVGTGTAFTVVEQAEFSGIYGVDPELKNMTEPLNDTYIVRTPQLHELLEDYNIPEQTVTLTPGNIMGFAPVAGEEDRSIEQYLTMEGGGFNRTAGELGGFKYMKDIKYKFEFPDVTLNAFAGGSARNSPVQVLVRGGLALGDFDLTARYSAFKGYDFGFTVGEEMYLVVTLQAEQKGDLKIPLFGFDIGLPGGNCSLGVFIIVELDGDIRIEIEANEYTRHYIGMGGKTFCYVPCSFGPKYKLESFELGGDTAVQGAINGRVKVGPMAELKIFGLDLVGAGAFVGLGLSSKTAKDDPDLLDVRLYCFFEIYVSLLGKKMNLVNEDITILKRKQRNLGKYKVVFDEAFVAPGRVGGKILLQPGRVEDPWEPVDGIDYRIRITHTDKNGKKSATTYPLDGSWAKTKYGGEFYIGDGLGKDHGYDFGSYTAREEDFGKGENGIPDLWKDDEIIVEFVGDGKSKTNPYKSEPVNPSLPFTDVSISEADYYNDYLVGHVSPQRMKDWTKDPKKYAEDDRCVWVTPPPGIIGVVSPEMIETSWLNSPYNNPDSIFYNPEVFDMCAWWQYGGWGGVYGYGKHWKTDDMPIPYPESNNGYFKTDSAGLIDTRVPFSDVNVYGGSGNFIDSLNEKAEYIVNPYFDITYHGGPNSGAFYFRYEYRGCIVTTWMEYTNTTMDLQFNRIILPVEDSYEKTVINEGLIDEYVVDAMQYDEYIWIINPNGERLPTDEEVFDFMTVKTAADAETYNSGFFDTENISGYNLIRTAGNGTSTTLLSRRVTVEWVWQPHPDPARYDLPPDASGTTEFGGWSTTAGGTIETNPTGLFPACSIEGAPKGVTIDRDTGVLTVPAGLPLGQYTFKIKAVQEYRGAAVEFFNVNHLGSNKTYTLPDEEFYRHAPAAPYEEDFTLWIRESPPVIQPAEQTEHGYTFEVDRNGPELTQKINTIAGEPPIFWSLRDEDGVSPPPDFISIDYESGVLYIQPDIIQETAWYGFYIIAENEAGEDSVYCKVLVYEQAPEVREAPRLARVVPDEMTQNTDYAKQFKASGSAPLYWSLEPASSSQPVPAEASIDNNGMLLIRGSIYPNTYSFVVKVSNDVGSDSAVFTIKVNYDPLTFPRSFPGKPSEPPVINAVKAMSFSYGTADPDKSAIKISSEPAEAPAARGDPGNPVDAVSVAYGEKGRSLKGLAEDQLAETEAERLWDDEGEPDIDALLAMTPLNEVTIRWSDPRDCFVDERLTVNGAEFVFWDSNPSVIPKSEPYLDIYWAYFNMVGSTDRLMSDALSIDRFHQMSYEYVRPETPPGPGATIYVEGMLRPEYDSGNLYALTKEKIEETQIVLVSPEAAQGPFGEWIQDSGFIAFDFSDPGKDAARTESPDTVKLQTLLYGPHLSEMEAQKSGPYTVALTQGTGATVSGRYFTTLAELRNMSLIFEQEGLTLTFDGKDVKKGSILETTLLDLKYYPDIEEAPDTPAKTMMLESAAMSGGETYAYSFSRHSGLPATGTFAVTTNISEGAGVNVYRYEGDIDNFTLIADNLTVGSGGVVTYRGDMLAEYLITTNTIDRALSQSGSAGMLLIIIIIAAAAAAAVTVILVLRRKKTMTGGQRQ